MGHTKIKLEGGYLFLKSINNFRPSGLVSFVSISDFESFGVHTCYIHLSECLVGRCAYLNEVV